MNHERRGTKEHSRRTSRRGRRAGGGPAEQEGWMGTAERTLGSVSGAERLPVHLGRRYSGGNTRHSQEARPY
jgi:hypothetical protein